MVAVWAAGHEDLLVGDMAFGSDGTQEQLDHAERKINAHLGRYYQLPLPTLVDADADLLRLIHTELATGYFILSRAGVDQDFFEYGKWLVDQGCMKLEKIGTEYDLHGTTSADDDTPASPTGAYQPTHPQVINVFGAPDLMSGFETDYFCLPDGT